MQSQSDRNLYQTSFVPADLVSEFKAPQDSILARVTQYLPPVTAFPTITKSQVSSDMMFQIPDSLGCIDTKTMRLHLDVKVTLKGEAGKQYAQGWVKLDNAGVGAMLNTLTLSSGGMNIEQVTNVGALVGMLNANTPEDYQEGVLSITEKTQYNEPLEKVDLAEDGGKIYTVVTSSGPYAFPGGKRLIEISEVTILGDYSTGITVATSISNQFTAAVNMPLGFFNTNKPVHTHLMGGMRLNISFNPYLQFLVFSPVLASSAAAQKSTVVSEFANSANAVVNAMADNITVEIVDAQLRYDLLTLSQEFLGMMKQSIRELGSFEYPYSSYRVSTNTLSNSTRQVVKISGTSGSVLSDITFAINPYPENEPLVSSQSFYSASKLKSFYFQIGGLSVPNKPITTMELSNAGNGRVAARIGESVTDTEADGFVEMLKSMNIFKSYSIGVKQNSSRLINSAYVRTELVADDLEADAEEIIQGASRVYSYSFTQSYDAEVVSGFTLSDNSEISLVLEFAGAPRKDSRIITALNYSQKYITSSSGQSYNQI